MSDFVDPLTRASAGSDEDEDQVVKKEEAPAGDVGKQQEDDDEDDIFDTEGKTEEKPKEPDDLDDVIDLVKDGSLTLLRSKSKKSSNASSGAEDSYLLDDQQDMFISVEKPKKVILSMETFITYQVTTKTTRSTFDNSEYRVRRRYQDFVWLRSKLEEDYPTHLIPPLPSKFIVKGMVDRFSNEFVGTRSRALDSFLKRLSEHPVISFSENLKTFLTIEDFSVFRKQNKPGLLSRVGGSVRSAASVGSSMRSRGHEPEFDEMSEHVANFKEQMSVMDRVAERLLGEEKELVADLKEYAPTYSSWASQENQILAPIMTSLSKCIYTSAEAARKNAENHELYFIPPLKEYILYCDGIEQVLKRRDIMQATKDRCSEDLKRRKEDKENLPATDQSYSIGAMLGRNPDEVRQQKSEKLDQQIQELTERYEELSDMVEKSNADLRSDIERWKFNKKQDMKQILSQLADSHIRCQSQNLASWESLIPLMQGKVDFGDLGLASGDLEEVETRKTKTSVSNDYAE